MTEPAQKTTAMVPSRTDAGEEPAAECPDAGRGGARAGIPTRADLAGVGRADLEARVIALSSERTQQQELLERQQTDLHAIGQELISLRRDVERLGSAVEQRADDLGLIAAAIAMADEHERRARMPRPHRPNTNPGAPRGSAAKKAGHVKQETAAERRERKRAEAEARAAAQEKT